MDELVEQGLTLPEIELELIDDAPVGDDARDALWLYAWGRTECQRPAVPA